MPITNYFLGIVYSFLVVFVQNGFYIVVITALLRIGTVLSQRTLKIGTPQTAAT